MRRIHVIPNGTELFEGRGDSLPRALSGLARPLIGYVGNMSDRIDWSLLGDVVAQRPDWTFVLAGPTDGRSEARELGRRTNVVMPGVVEYSEIGRHESSPSRI